MKNLTYFYLVVWITLRLKILFPLLFVSNWKDFYFNHQKKCSHAGNNDFANPHNQQTSFTAALIWVKLQPDIYIQKSTFGSDLGRSLIGKGFALGYIFDYLFTSLYDIFVVPVIWQILNQTQPCSLFNITIFICQKVKGCASEAFFPLAEHKVTDSIWTQSQTFAKNIFSNKVDTFFYLIHQ